MGGTGSAGGLLTRDILRRVFPVEEGQQARRNAIMSPHELHHEGQRGLSHRDANGWRLATRGPRGKDGWRQDALLGTNASSGAAYTPMTQVIRMRDALCTIYHWVTTPDGDADPYTGLARPIAMRRPSDWSVRARSRSSVFGALCPCGTYWGRRGVLGRDGCTDKYSETLNE